MSKTVEVDEHYVGDLELAVEFLRGELLYTRQLLEALLTGDMPPHCDYTTMIYAMRGRKYLEYVRKSKLNKECGDMTTTTNTTTTNTSAS